MDKVSICVPVYNLEKYISLTIESVLAQTYKNIELIVVDDASTDSTAEIVKEFEAHDSRVKYITYDNNKGPMFARQVAVEASTGNFITFCDGDDTLRDDYVEKLLTLMTPDVDMGIGQLSYVWENGRTMPYHIKAKLKYGSDKENVFRSILVGDMPQGLCGKLFRASVIKNTQIHILENCTRGEDACTLFQYVDNIRKAALVDEYIYKYYQRSASSTNSAMSDRAVEGICITSKLRSEIIAKYPKLKEYEYSYFQKNLINTFYANCSINYYRSCIINYGLNRYLDTISILRYSGPKMMVKFILSIYSK